MLVTYKYNTFFSVIVLLNSVTSWNPNSYVITLGVSNTGQSYSFGCDVLEYFCCVERISYCILKEYALQTKCLFMYIFNFACTFCFILHFSWVTAIYPLSPTLGGDIGTPLKYMQNFGDVDSWKAATWKIKEKKRLKDNIKIDLTEIGCEDGRWMEVQQIFVKPRNRIGSRPPRCLFCFVDIATNMF
jgi:hypothetical protein